MERTIQMKRGDFIASVRRKDGHREKKKISGYIFSYLGVEFGCSNNYYCEGEIKKQKYWNLYDLETGRVCADAVSRRSFSYIITPQFVRELNEAKQKLYKSEN